jgi:hypothetical protein
MRAIRLLLVLFLSVLSACAGDARIIKVLPQLLDKQGRNAINPSLFDRDAYQMHLRLNTNDVSAIRFEVQYKAKRVEGPLLLRLEIRGSKTDLGKREVFETDVAAGGYFSKWGRIQFDRTTSERIGTLVAWRASLVKDGEAIATQESFLW